MVTRLDLGNDNFLCTGFDLPKRDKKLILYRIQQRFQDEAVVCFFY